MPHLPIDCFFRALAVDQHHQAIGVVLSGMGCDGTAGLGAVKEHGGATFVQTPVSAKFDSMPRHAIDAGYADVVAPVAELATRIAAYGARTPLSQLSELALAPKADQALEQICVLLRRQTGHDFSQYKRSTIYRRIERRVGLHGLKGIIDYVPVLKESPQEGRLLFKELLIGVTNFFSRPGRVGRC